jgi:hypothetical protein
MAASVAALLSSTYYLLKLRQECGAVPLLTCAIRQVVGVSEPLASQDRGAEEARRAAEQYKREREDAERRAQAAEEARRLAEARGAAEQARKLAEQKERAAEEARRAAEQYQREREEAARLARAAEEARKSALAQVVLSDLAGMWRGVYSYSGTGQRPVEFMMSLQVYGNACRGRMEEPNTFGLSSAPRLYANVDCYLVRGSNPARLMMRKTYDGTGGQSHSIDYEGEIASDLRGITGVWQLGTQSGRFSLIKQ